MHQKKKQKSNRSDIPSRSNKFDSNSESSSWDIPENLQDLFSVFWKFVKYTNNDSSDETDYNNPDAEALYEDDEGPDQRG